MKPFAGITAALLIISSIVRAELFVSDFNNNVVLRYNETNGAFIDVFVSNANTRLNQPHGLAFGPDGHLYVASAGNDSVLRYNGTNGAFMDVFIDGSAGLDYPVRLIFRSDGFLYVSSQLNDRVLRFNSANGSFVNVFVTNSAALDGPSDMTFGPDGNLYVTGRFNDRVVRYDGTTGAFIDVVAGSNLSQPFGLRFGLTNDLLVVSGNGNRVQRFHDGVFTGTYAEDGGLDFPVGIVRGPDANFYIASYGAHKVGRYDAITGAYRGDFVTAGSGGLSGPNFMVFRPPIAAAPELRLASAGTNVLISWSARNIPAIVQQTADLASGWSRVTNDFSVISETNLMTLPASERAEFFRLELLE